MKKLVLSFALLLPACTLISTSHGTAQFWGDYTDFAFSDGSVKLTATSMIHSSVVRAHYHGLVLLGGVAVSSAIPGVGVGERAAAAAVPSLVSGFTQPSRITPSPVVKTH